MDARLRPALLSCCVSLITAASLAPSRAADPAEATPPAASSKAAPEDAPTSGTVVAEPTLVERITVTATRAPNEIDDTAGTTSVITDEEIARFGMTDTRDLLRFEPGVYVDGDLDRLGLSGFNIRGIGGNRVMTRIDGIEAAEQFAFGPIAAPQYALDLDSVESVEISRSAGSALYGSDALGGVVSFRTKDPGDYLSATERDYYLGVRTGYDGRDDGASAGATAAFRGKHWQSSIQVMGRAGHERSNQGTVGGDGAARTIPNPQEADSTDFLGKWVQLVGEGNVLALGAEVFEARTDTEGFSFRGPSTPGTAIADFDATDTQGRYRLSAEQTLSRNEAFFDTLTWRAALQAAETSQDTTEQISRASGASQRDASFSFEQDTVNAELEIVSTPGSGHRLAYGASVTGERFDQLRNRSEFVVGSGTPVPSALVFPTKYSPKSRVLGSGLYLQDEMDFASGRLRIVPGVRFDSHRLDADANDPVYLAGNPGTDPPVDMNDAALSPKLGVIYHWTEAWSAFGQYARGFRTPPYSDVNNGFANVTFGYRTLSNPDLRPETSDNYEAGVRARYARGSLSVSAFDNHYDDFIETVVVNVAPDGFIDFQPQNVERVRIFGVEMAGDLALGRSWSLRGALSVTKGTNETSDEPLDSISPPQLVAGGRYRSPSGRWQSELTATYATEKDADDLPSGSTQYRTPAYLLVDLFGTVQLSKAFSLQAGVHNVTDETYWTWADVRGRAEGSPSLDRFTSPGRSVAANLRFTY